MTVKQLKKKLEGLPDNADVMIDIKNSVDDDFQYNLALSAKVKTVNFKDGRLKASAKCLIISTEM